MMDFNVRELIHREHHQELLREAAKARLVREALSGYEMNPGLLRRAMDWLRNRLAARQPSLPLPAASRPQ